MTKTLKQTLTDLRKAGQTVSTLTAFDMVPKPLPTGNLTVDALTGIGGLPRGRVVELFGPPSSGKTTTALQAAALVQQTGGRVAYWDYERSLAKDFVQALGVDPDAEHEDGEPSFIYDQPKTLEDGANTFRALMPWLDMLIVDSLAGMVTEHELEVPTGKVEGPIRAKMLHQFMRQVIGRIADLGVCIVYVNHQQDKVDMTPMGQKLSKAGVQRLTTPGGTAIKFYASLRLQYQQVGSVRTQEYDVITNETIAVPTWTKTKVSVVKNKVGDPFGQGEIRFRRGLGFSQSWSALDVLVRHGVIKLASNGIYRFVDPKLAPEITNSSPGWGVAKDGTPWMKGELTVVREMDMNPAWRGAMITAATELLGKGWDLKLSAEEQAKLVAEETGEKEELQEDMAAAPQEVDSAALDQELGQA